MFTKVPRFAVPFLPYLKSLVATVLGAVVAVVTPLVQGGHLGLATLWAAIVAGAVTGVSTWWVRNRDKVTAVIVGSTIPVTQTVPPV